MGCRWQRRSIPNLGTPTPTDKSVGLITKEIKPYMEQLRAQISWADIALSAKGAHCNGILV